MSDLKLCPFCGGKATCEKMMIHWRVKCENDCTGYNEKQKAIELWNRRVNDE